MSQEIASHLEPNKVAGMAGGFYLAFIVASVLADMLGHIGLGGVQQVYQAIVTDGSSFRGASSIHGRQPSRRAKMASPTLRRRSRMLTVEVSQWR